MARVLGWLARAVAIIVLAVLMLVAAVLVNLDTAVVRRVAAAQVSSLVLAPLFKGSLTIVSIGHVDPFGVSGASVRIADATGRQVLAAEGVSARIRTWQLVRTLVFGTGDILVSLSNVRIEHVDVCLDGDAKGLFIAQTFEPRPSPKPLPAPPPPAPHPTGREPEAHVLAPDIHVTSGWAHGLIDGLPYIDGEVHEADASFRLDGTTIAIDASKGRVLGRRIALGADAEGSFSGHLELGPDLPLGGHVVWDGTVGTLRETATAGIERGRLDATVDVPPASAESIRSFWTGSTIVSSASAHLDAHGPLAAIDFSAHAELEHARADVKGVLGWGPTESAKLHLDVRDVDLSRIVPSLDPTSLSLTGVAEATLTSGKLVGNADLDIPAGHFGKNPVPHTTVRTDGFRDASGSFGGDATLVIDEPGAPTTISLHAQPTAQAAIVEFSIASHAVRLGALHRFSTGATGNVRVLGKGNIDLEKLKLDVALDSHGHSFTQGELSVRGITVQGHAKGSLLNPDVDVTVGASDVGWGARRVDTLGVTVRGKAMSPHVTVVERSKDLPELDATADVAFLDGPSIHRVSIHLAHASETADLVVDQVRFGGGGVAVDDLRLDGFGSRLVASGSRVGLASRVHIENSRIDVGRLAMLLGITVVRAGTVDVEGDLSVNGAVADGHVKVALEHGRFASFENLSAYIDGTIKGRRIEGRLGARVASVGWIDVEAKPFVLGGLTGLSRGALRSAWGDVALSGQIDLAALTALLPLDPEIPRVTGRLDIKGRFERDSAADITPLVELQVDTAGLSVRSEHPTWSLNGVDAGATVRVNGDTGFVELGAHVHDAKGDLASLEATSGDIPFAALYDTPTAALAKLPLAAFEARLTVPKRAVTSWPTALRRVPMDGDLEAQGFVSGPLVAPHVVLNAKLSSVKNAGTRFSSPIAAALRAVYNLNHGDLELHVTDEKHDVLSSEAHVDLAVRDLLAGNASPPWRASAKMHVEQFPLGMIGALDDRQVRGRLSGDAELTDLHVNAKARASLVVDTLKIGDAVYPSTKAVLIADGTTLSADVRVDESDGFGLLKANVPATWGVELAPRPDPKKALDVLLQAKNFRAAVILPFVRGSVDQLDGLVDADIHATIDPTTAALHAEGTATVRDGLFQVASFGGELHGIEAKVSITPEGLLTLERFEALGLSGQVQASASARLDGLNLVAASAVVQIPKSRPLPLSVGGAALGTIDGTINVTESLSADRKIIEVKADIPTLHFLAPDQGSQDVQPLGDMPRVKTGVHSGPSRTFIPERPDPAEEADAAATARTSSGPEIRVVTHLGDDVMVRKGTDVRVELAGGPTISVADKTTVSGQIRLRAGALNLYGKSFDIEQGTVSFVGDDPSNPQVSVTAGWIASDGTQVKADFIGPLKTGKVTLRSEPPTLSKNEIIQLLLFGSIDDTTASAQAPGTSSAEGVAGNIATQPLNRVFSQFGLGAISAKVDTSTVNAKPEVEVQIAKDISVAVAQIIGQPPVGTSQDTSFLSVNWRFLRKWSVTATVGNAGTTIVDMLWKWRY